MSITTTANLPPQVLQTFSRRLLSTPVPNMIHGIAAIRKYMPRNGGTTLRMSRYDPLPTATAPLGNLGIEPPATNINRLDIDATISFYGQYIVVNEQCTLQNQDPVLNALVERLGVSMRQTEDSLIRDMLLSTASFVNCTGGVNGDNPTEITDSDIANVVRALMGNNAWMISDHIEGQDRFGTAPVRSAYFGMCHTDLTKDLTAVNGFLQKDSYPKADGLSSEWGASGSVRFLVSSIGSMTPNASALGKDVYNIFIGGLESYATIQQDGYSSSFIYRDALFSGALALNASVGWKMAMCPRMLNDLWLFNLRCTLA